MSLNFKLQPNNSNFLKAMEKAKTASEREKTFDNQIPWMGAAIGIFIGALVATADRVFACRPFLTNPLLMLLVTIAVALIGYFTAMATRYCLKYQKMSLLSPPVNSVQED